MGRIHVFGDHRAAVVLYVEDDDATAFLLQTAVRENGIALDLFRVVDGNAALSFVNRDGAYVNAPTPDLVVLDLNLPGRSGLEILTEIRNNPKLRDLTVVIFSSSSSHEERDACLAAGADAYFTKHSDLNAFFSTVEVVCRQYCCRPRAHDRAIRATVSL
jgi:CheY-like chemotaxis protein